MTDVIVIVIVMGLILGVSYYIWRNKKNGTDSGCGGSCAGCSGSCHKQ